MKPVTVYSSAYCPFCIRALQLLKQKGVSPEVISVDGNSIARQEMAQKSGRRTVPQIWIGEAHIGGCDDLFALEQAGELSSKLA